MSDLIVVGFKDEFKADEVMSVHSGDSACSLPPYSLSDATIAELKVQTMSDDTKTEAQSGAVLCSEAVQASPQENQKVMNEVKVTEAAAQMAVRLARFEAFSEALEILSNADCVNDAIARVNELRSAAKPRTVPRPADDHHVPRCGCEKVHRCVEDRCPKCCYCGAAWQGRESVSTPYTSSVQSEPLRTESGPNAGPAEEVARHCAQYVDDIGECLVCTLENEAGQHEDWCPVGRYMSTDSVSEANPRNHSEGSERSEK